MIGKLIGAATGAAINKEQHGNPITGAVVGFATMAVARRFLPVRIAGLGATIAAGYLTKKLADRAERRKDTELARATAEDAGVADSFAMIHDDAKPVAAKKLAAKKPVARKAPAKPRRPATQSARAIKVPEPN
ncbi:MAG: hypothetical protein GW859_00665 [Sphingomonadales bacterium]|nr:hypothetical protein [Sphingomonadales bacterium]